MYHPLSHGTLGSHAKGTLQRREQFLRLNTICQTEKNTVDGRNPAPPEKCRFPCKYQTNHGFPWFPSGAKWISSIHSRASFFVLVAVKGNPQTQKGLSRSEISNRKHETRPSEAAPKCPSSDSPGLSAVLLEARSQKLNGQCTWTHAMHASSWTPLIRAFSLVSL